MNANPLPNEPRTVGSGGGPPYDNDMDRRLTILETRFDTILPTLATKHDLEMLRADLRAEFREEMDKLRRDVAEQIEKLRQDMMTMMKWIVALVISMLIAFCGSTFAMLNAIKTIPPARAAVASPPPASPSSPAPLSQ